MEILCTINDQIAYLKINGSITNENHQLLQEKLDEVLESKAKKLEIDFVECHTINSMGIGKLISFYKDFSEKGNEVEIVKCSAHIYELFMSIKLNQLISISLEDEEE